MDGGLAQNKSFVSFLFFECFLLLLPLPAYGSCLSSWQTHMTSDTLNDLFIVLPHAHPHAVTNVTGLTPFFVDVTGDDGCLPEGIKSRAGRVIKVRGQGEPLCCAVLCCAELCCAVPCWAFPCAVPYFMQRSAHTACVHPVSLIVGLSYAVLCLVSCSTLPTHALSLSLTAIMLCYVVLCCAELCGALPHAAPCSHCMRSICAHPVPLTAMQIIVTNTPNDYLLPEYFKAHKFMQPHAALCSPM